MQNENRTIKRPYLQRHRSTSQVRIIPSLIFCNTYSAQIFTLPFYGCNTIGQSQIKLEEQPEVTFKTVCCDALQKVHATYLHFQNKGILFMSTEICSFHSLLAATATLTHTIAKRQNGSSFCPFGTLRTFSSLVFCLDIMINTVEIPTPSYEYWYQ